MLNRILLIILASIVIMITCIASPQFNWGGIPGQSMWTQYVTNGGGFMEMLQKAGLFTLICFLSLLFLFGLKSKKKK